MEYFILKNEVLRVTKKVVNLNDMRIIRKKKVLNASTGQNDVQTDGVRLTNVCAYDRPSYLRLRFVHT